MPLTIVLRRYALLALVAGLHLALFACWRLAAWRTAPHMPQRESEMVFLTLMPSLPAKSERARIPTTTPEQPRRSAVRLPMPDAPAAPLAPIAPPPAAPAPAPDPAAPNPFAQTAPVVESVLDRSRRAAIGVDRELRKESKNDNDRVLAHEPKLAQDIALAYKGSGAFSMSETVLPNGDTLAKVTTPFTTYCILKRGNRDKAGLSAIDNAGRTLIVSCPK